MDTLEAAYKGGKKMLHRNQDGTGPRGKGPRTGRGKGGCPKPKGKPKPRKPRKPRK